LAHEDYNELLAEAFDHLNKGRTRLALTAATKVYELKPESFSSICCYAWAQLENNNPLQALELADYAVKLYPYETDTRLYRGYLLMRMGIYDGAINDLEYAITHKTEMLIWANLNKSRSLAGQGKYSEAFENIDAAIKINGSEPKLTFVKEKLKYILDSQENNFKSLFLKKKTLLNDAEYAFREKEYWFSLWAAKEILKTDKGNLQANLLEIESMASLFQFRPALAWAEQIKHLYVNDDRFQSLYQRIRKAVVSDEHEIILQVKEKDEVKRWDFQKGETKLFEVLHSKTFELLENLRTGKRTYLLQFSEETVRYIGVEIIIDNPFHGNKKVAADGMAVWFLDNREVGRHHFELPIEKEWESLEFVQSWGTDNPGFWKHGQGKVDIYLNDEKLCTRWFFIGSSDIVNFEVVENKEEKFEHQEKPVIEQPHNVYNKQIHPTEEKTLEELLNELNTFVGLNKVKQSMKDFVDYLNFINERKKLGLKTQENLSFHCVFLGNPGTGKTTVARLLGKIFKAMGILKNGHVIEVDRSGLVGQFIGETAQKADKVISEAVGGLLFIDEAYTLIKQGNQQDFGREAIDILLKRMEDMPGEFVVIAAGYPEEMTAFISSNPGMKSRFSHFFYFDDYTPEELVEIFKLTSAKEEYDVKEDALEILKKELVRLYRRRDKSFGNARLVRNLFNEAKIQLSKRYLKIPEAERTREAMTTIFADDIEAVMKSATGKDVLIGIDEENLNIALNKLNNLTGLESVKKEINELVKVARYYIEQGENPQNKFNNHVVFLGNPGTGKTTVARLFSEIYSALGILPRGHLVEADRQMLVASYVGQTAERTKEIIDRAMGGTLFIDEAYTLSPKGEGNDSDFGHEAIDTLLKRMEDDRGKFLVIAAGYTDNMNKFLDSNPGLQSRFTRKIFFEDFSPDELLLITEKHLNEKGHTLDEEIIDPLKSYYNKVFRERDKTFGNARLVRNLIDNAIKNHMLRLVDTPPEERHEEAIRLITIEDIKDFISPKKVKEIIQIDGSPQLLSQYIKELHDLAGIESVKKTVDKLLNSLKVSKLREKRGLHVLPRNLNAIFTGNSGTGKKTVARILGKIFKEMGVLSKGHLVEADRTTLLGGYQNQTASKTEETIQKALGGILFLEDAWSLLKFANDPGQEAIETLIKKIDEYKGQFICIAAGPVNEMKEFIEFNPGLHTRFTNQFSFEDFTPRQMLEIALEIADKNGYLLDEGAWQILHEIFQKIYNNRNSSFANAGTVRNALYKAISFQEDRILTIQEPSNEDLCTITFEDVECIDLKEL
jgi:SpoVK/Ycf46/Vps4 family AAA+-type ATPase/tetratricopeptide (TPR) repeat protein